MSHEYVQTRREQYRRAFFQLLVIKKFRQEAALIDVYQVVAEPCGASRHTIQLPDRLLLRPGIG